MKRAIALLLVLALCMLAGCERANTDPTTPKEGIQASAAGQGKDTADGGEITICINKDFERPAKDVLEYLKASGCEASFELLVLPSGKEERESKISRLRTEIMGGGGPDVFVLPGPNPNYVESREELFQNVGKTMQSGALLPLDDLLAESEIAHVEACDETIMRAGQANDEQLILPLQVTYSAAVLEGTPALSSWEDISSGSNKVRAAFGRLMGTSFFNTLGQLVDDTGENLAIEKEDLVALVTQATELHAFAFEGEGGAPVGLMGENFLQQASAAGEGMEIVPLYNNQGGVTANITLYAAINRNCADPSGAFRFVEVLLSDTLQGGRGFTVEGTGRSYCSTFYYGTDTVALPVKTSLLADYYVSKGMAAEQAKALAGVEITTARVYADLDADLLSLFVKCQGASEEEIAQAVDETYTTMQMKLAE